MTRNLFSSNFFLFQHCKQHLSNGKEPSKLLFRSLKWIRMVLFSLSTIWGLGYIHFYPRFNSQGNDPCTYPHPLCNEKAKERPGQWRNARCAPLSTKLRALEHLGPEGVPQVVWQRAVGFWMEGDERICFSIHNNIKMSVRLDMICE